MAYLLFSVIPTQAGIQAFNENLFSADYALLAVSTGGEAEEPVILEIN